MAQDGFAITLIVTLSLRGFGSVGAFPQPSDGSTVVATMSAATRTAAVGVPVITPVRLLRSRPGASVQRFGLE